MNALNVDMKETEIGVEESFDLRVCNFVRMNELKVKYFGGVIIGSVHIRDCKTVGLAHLTRHLFLGWIEVSN